MADATQSELPIVVGVDGSEASLDALHWAVRQARLTHAPLRAVTAWAFPEHPTPFGIVPALPLPPDPLDEVRYRLEDAVRGAIGEEPDLDVRADVVTGDPVSVLLHASEHAALLVVGSRGRGAFAGVMLGSVSGHCVHHSTCPVVVVRHREQGR